ncbi:hypothetical protein BC940DRAFT_304464 [Gongronella butleri]|nr:hypothetical protein BC940DRAFT_304464 [Gongronella butleri]
MGQSSSKIDASMPFASVEYDERDEDEATDSLVCSQSSLFHKTQSLSHTVDDTDTPCAWMHLLNDIQYVDRTYYPSSDELLRPLPPLPRLCDYPSSSTSSVNSSIPTSLVQRAYSSLSLSPSSPLPVRHPLTTATTHTLTMADLQQQDKHLQTIHLAHQNLTTLSANIGLFTMIRRLNL